MQIVMVHGYFLKGTGSNLFVENSCRELCKMGHQVNLFCQENDPDQFDFIEKAFDFNDQNSESSIVYQNQTLYPGKCHLYRPNLMTQGRFACHARQSTICMKNSGKRKRKWQGKRRKKAPQVFTI